MKYINGLPEIILLALLTYSAGSVAQCTLTSGTTQTRNVGANLTSGLNVPQDTPDGTVIYEELASIVPKYEFYCNAQVSMGFLLNPSLGTVPAKSTLFPLGNTGLSFRLFSDIEGNYYRSVRPMPSGSWFLTGDTMRFEIVKTGNLSPQSTVPAGYLGQQIADELVSMNLYLVKPIVVNAAACQTPAVSVQMGDDYQLFEFSNPGDTPRVVKFNIGLNQCQSGIKKITYSLIPTTQVIDPQKGIVALNANSTAKGIGLQLMTDAGQPIKLDSVYPFNEFNTNETNFNIPLSAAYYRLPGSKLEAGTANAAVTFVVNYL